jgi:hypothetical protein
MMIRMKAMPSQRKISRASNGMLVAVVAVALAVTALLDAPNPSGAAGVSAAGASSSAPGTAADTSNAASSGASRNYAVTLGEPGDFVTQYTDVACVGASIQTMLNQCST